MPLIIITGTPCSGKTFRAQQIAQEFESRIAALASNESNRSVLYLPSYHASLDPPAGSWASYSPPTRSESPRDRVYDTARLEKTARAEEFSAIKRTISKNAVVIADAPNYIKGFRYQLYCEAKAAGTRSVVVHTSAREDECVSWNNARLEAWGWPSGTDEVTAGEQSTVQGPKIGRDVLGDLQPESHTALYGDLATDATPRSRSSSVSAARSEDEAGIHKSQKPDTMTLKSLYISDKKEAENAPRHPSALPSVQETSPSSYPLPPSTAPPPKSSLPYSPKTLRSLLMRYEPPSPFTRWDTPLFTIPSTDPHPPYDAIWTSIFPAATKPTSKKALTRQRQEEEHAQKLGEDGTNVSGITKSDETVPEVKQHAATMLPSATAPNALQILEGTTGEVIKLILAAAREAGVAEAGEGGELSIFVPMQSVEKGASQDAVAGEDFQLEVPESVALSQPTLQRLRRKYTQVQKGGIAHGQGYTQGRRNVVVGFLAFLEAEWAVVD